MSRTGANLILATVSLGLTLAVAELALRAFVEPARYSSGTIFGWTLPPERIVTMNRVPTPEERIIRQNNWHGKIIIEGIRVTRSDLWGILREDSLLGTAPQEGAVSTNGWWQTNELGARSRSPTTPTPTAGQHRALFFGDSFIQGSRVPQEETVTHYITQMYPGIEAVNFGVDGYGMAQAFLRFRTVKDELDFDHVVLVFVPTADLWRDISVNRKMAFNWGMPTTQPRFKVVSDTLALIPSLYWRLDQLIADNLDGDTDLLRQHHRQYEAFYLPARYESIPVLDWSVLFRLARRARHIRQKEALLERVMEPDGEAVQVSRLIFRTMAAEVQETGSGFTLAVLPMDSDVDEFARDAEFRDRWNAVLGAVCGPGFPCLDLMPALQELTALDAGYDGSHYGPRTNNHIAGIIGEHLNTILKESAEQDH